MENRDRANYGHAAIEAGAPDYGQNDDADTDAADAIANIFHARTWAEDDQTALTHARALAERAIDYVLDERESS